MPLFWIALVLAGQILEPNQSALTNFNFGMLPKTCNIGVVFLAWLAFRRPDPSPCLDAQACLPAPPTHAVAATCLAYCTRPHVSDAVVLLRCCSCMPRLLHAPAAQDVVARLRMLLLGYTRPHAHAAAAACLRMPACCCFACCLSMKTLAT
jgi:hypothetical protein